MPYNETYLRRKYVVHREVAAESHAFRARDCSLGLRCEDLRVRVQAVEELALEADHVDRVTTIGQGGYHQIHGILFFLSQKKHAL